MRQFVDEDEAWLARQRAIEVELGQPAAAVFDEVSTLREVALYGLSGPNASLLDLAIMLASFNKIDGRQRGARRRS